MTTLMIFPPSPDDQVPCSLLAITDHAQRTNGIYITDEQMRALAYELLRRAGAQYTKPCTFKQLSLKQLKANAAPPATDKFTWSEGDLVPIKKGDE